MELADEKVYETTRWQNAIMERDKFQSIIDKPSVNLPSISWQEAIASVVAWQVQADEHFARIEYINTLLTKTV